MQNRRSTTELRAHGSEYSLALDGLPYFFSVFDLCCVFSSLMRVVVFRCWQLPHMKPFICPKGRQGERERGQRNCSTDFHDAATADCNECGELEGKLTVDRPRPAPDGRGMVGGRLWSRRELFLHLLSSTASNVKYNMAIMWTKKYLLYTRSSNIKYQIK